MRTCLDIWKKYQKKFVLENIPFCMCEEDDWQYIIDNYKLDRNVFDLEHGKIDSTETLGKVKDSQCSKCDFNKVCPWLPEEYIEISPKIKPIIRDITSL